MGLRILSRSSALARLQVALVSRALSNAHPGIEIECLTRASAGDRDQTSPLWKLTEKGAFTADLSDALLQHGADIVVHSFKDLPIEMPMGTLIAGALPRADPRDVLLLRKAAIPERPSALTILSCSPRRTWLLQQNLPSLLPWAVRTVTTTPVRGNIETRLRKLVEGTEHGLVVAKAALDRLLTFGPRFAHEACLIRAALARCEWMVMPMRGFPWAPAQGAIALEIADGRDDLMRALRPVLCQTTLDAVNTERSILAAHGGGCHQALGAAVMAERHGRVISVRANEESGGVVRWELETERPAIEKVTADRVWPNPAAPVISTRRPKRVGRPTPDVGLWVSRAEAVPADWVVDPGTLVWASGDRTWRRLAERGVWVHGCADGLGDDRPDVDALAGRVIPWLRLTHQDAVGPGALATYQVTTELPEDLPTRSHFFWTSGTLFKHALERWPELRGAWHASGPGRTRDTIQMMLGDTHRAGVWLDLESWERDICL